MQAAEAQQQVSEAEQSQPASQPAEEHPQLAQQQQQQQVKQQAASGEHGIRLAGGDPSSSALKVLGGPQVTQQLGSQQPAAADVSAASLAVAQLAAAPAPADVGAADAGARDDAGARSAAAVIGGVAGMLVGAGVLLVLYRLSVRKPAGFSALPTSAGEQGGSVLPVSRPLPSIPEQAEVDL
jgi:hypothetical protein